ncbi:MAG: alpha-2-macroglobulin family protein [Spirochaetota bacterium]
MTKRNYLNRLIFIGTVSLGLLLANCGGEGEQNGVQTRARPLPESSSTEEYTDYIGSHTAGLIRRNDPVQVTLANPPAALDQAAAQKMLSFDPAIKGQVQLEQPATLLFVPDQPLPSGTMFQGKVDLSRMYEIPKDKAEYAFVFSTQKQNFEFEITDRSYDADVELRGRIRTADSAAAEKIEAALTGTVNYERIEWNHDSNNRLHSFTIFGIERTAKERKETLQLAGQSFGVDRTEELEFTVPGIGNFSFLSYQVKADEEGGIELNFSMPLDPEQDLTGRISIEERDDLPLSIEGSKVLIYPGSDGRQERQVSIHPSVRAAGGAELGQAVEFTIPARYPKPEVEVMIPGGILPSTDQHLIPIRAVSLKSIDVEVVRIFTDNMLQFLQNNRDVRGNNSIKKVGRPVAHDTISLEGNEGVNLYEWNRFDLDLSTVFEQEPGALYQVHLSFRPSSSLYPCPADGEAAQLPFPRGDWDSSSYTTRWDDFYSYYNWRDRDNPCAPSYYLVNDKQVSILASDLGVIAKKADAAGVHAYVRNLVSTDPEAGAVVRVYNYQQQEMGSAETDATGYANIPVEGQPFALEAEKEGMRSWMRIDDGASLSLSDFAVDGVEARRGIKGFIYGERGVWRPGDDIFLNFILQDQLKTLPEHHPVTFELIDPKGRTVEKMLSRKGVGPIYPFHTRTDAQAPTGNWTARVRVGDEVFEKTVKVETIKPNRLKVNLSVGSGRITWEDRGSLQALLAAEWLHGATAGHLDAEVELTSYSMPLGFDDYPAFDFNDPAKDYYQAARKIYDGRLDAQGSTRFAVPLSDKPELSGAVRMEFVSKVFENAGDFSFNKESAEYYPYRSYVGIDAPAGDARRNMLQTDTEHLFQIATVDAHGNPVSRRGVEIELYELSWRWWWDKSEDDIGRYLSSRQRNRIKRATIDTEDGRGQWKMRIDYPEWGRYYLRATDPVSGHTAGQVIYIDWPGWAGAPRRGDSGAALLSFQSDQEEYRVGDTAELSVPSDEGGRILISLENNTDVINSWWVTSQKDMTTVRFPVTAEMAPTCYIHATLVQPHAETANDRPIRMYGILPVQVTDPETRLAPRIVTADVFVPEEEVGISVHEARGRPMTYTLAVVDEGLTDLTNFALPDPWSSFNAKEALGVKTWDVYDDVIGSLGDSFGTLLSVGGGREEKPTPPDKPNRFKPVVEFFGPFRLEAGETAEHTFTMPLYIGSVKVMVVSAADEAWGSTEKNVPVRKDLMVLGSFPRRIAPGEISSLPVNVFAMKDGLGTVDVSVRASDGLELLGPASRQISFEQAGDGYLYFDIEAAETVGPAKVVIDARAAGVETRYEIELEIMTVNPPVTRLQDTIIEPGAEWTVRSESFGLAEEFSRSLEASWAPPLDLQRRLAYLIGYPHGCLEQTVSRAFPQLYLQSLTDLSAEQKSDSERYVSEAIEKTLRLQHEDGGFLYWPGRNRADPWVSSYAGHFLLESRSKGYHVPQEALDKWLGFQQNQARGWMEDKSEVAIQAYRLLSLAAAGEAEIGAMNRLTEYRYTGDHSRLQLAAAYAMAGRPDLARQLQSRVSPDWDRHSPQQHTYGSLLRDKAMALIAYTELEEQQARFTLAEDIARELSSDDWLSTQSTAFALMAMARHLGTTGRDEPVELRWQFEAERAVAESSAARYLLTDLPGGDGLFSVTNRMQRPLYVQIVNRGVPLQQELPKESRNLSMQVSYRPKDDIAGFSVDSIRSGVSFIAEVEITNTGPLDVQDLVLSQIFPSGWEILNQRMLGQQQAGDGTKDAAEYRDIRDDRVYTYFDLQRGQTKRFAVELNAAYMGEYRLPMVDCRAMYDNRYYARQPGRGVRVVE